MLYRAAHTTIKRRHDRRVDGDGMGNKWFAPALLLAALAGALAAWLLGDVAWLNSLTKTLQSSFLAALKMIIAPLIFFSLLSGILKLRDATSFGRLGALTLIYYTITSFIAIAIGLTVVFFIHPWEAQPPLAEMPAVSVEFIDADAADVWQILAGLARSLLVNPFAALAETNILGILMSALLLGLAAAVTLPKDSQLPALIDQITQVVYRVAGWVITLLPLGLFAIAFQLTARTDVATLIALGHFAGVVVGATLLHGLFVLPLICWLFTGRRPWDLLRQISQPLLTAFVTSSSAATLPISLRTAEHKLGVSAPKAAFVLPLGATMNMDGTALFEGIAVIFLAYMFGVELTPAMIVIVFFIAMLASAGAPGIPSGSMAGMQAVLLAVGIPLEGIALLLLIERPLDTIRTAVNVEGDLIGSMVIEKWTSSRPSV